MIKDLIKKIKNTMILSSIPKRPVYLNAISSGVFSCPIGEAQIMNYAIYCYIGGYFRKGKGVCAIRALLDSVDTRLFKQSKDVVFIDTEFRHPNCVLTNADGTLTKVLETRVVQYYDVDACEWVPLPNEYWPTAQTAPSVDITFKTL